MLRGLELRSRDGERVLQDRGGAGAVVVDAPAVTLSRWGAGHDDLGLVAAGPVGDIRLYPVRPPEVNCRTEVVNPAASSLAFT